MNERLRSSPLGSIRVKICGVTTAADALAATAIGADLVGLNFHRPSPRFVTVERAREIRDAIGSRARVVGVFVDRPLDEVLEIERTVGLDLLQFHGDEPIEEIRPVAARALRAFQVGRDFDPQIVTGYDQVWGLLFDAPHEVLRGGTGQDWRYTQVNDILASVESSARVLIAGGVDPSNVQRIVSQVENVWGVDVCSGVESEPGVKSVDRMRELIEAVRAAAHSRPKGGALATGQDS